MDDELSGGGENNLIVPEPVSQSFSTKIKSEIMGEVVVGECHPESDACKT